MQGTAKIARATIANADHAAIVAKAKEGISQVVQNMETVSTEIEVHPSKEAPPKEKDPAKETSESETEVPTKEKDPPKRRVSQRRKCPPRRRTRQKGRVSRRRKRPPRS
jgi:hypothetical protein